MPFYTVRSVTLIRLNSINAIDVTAYAGDILGEFLGYFWNIFGIFWGYFWDILGIFWRYFGDILGIFWGYFGDILRIFWGYFWDILGIFWGNSCQPCKSSQNIRNCSAIYPKLRSPFLFTLHLMHEIYTYE